MILYLAGGITGNNISFWQKLMKLYLSGTYSRDYIIKEAMKLYLAGNAPWRDDGIYDEIILNNKPYILESYYYLRKNKEWILKMRPFLKDFLLDSGAFTLFGNSNDVNIIDNYVLEYINFINKYNIDLFIELDIYSIVGVTKTEEIRMKIEKETNKKCIPVWHIFLGIDYYKKLCEEYKYIAIGASGRFDSKWTRSNPEKIKALVDYAIHKNVNVHGLGYSITKKLHDISFYSIDSTTWLYGNRGGFIYQFNGNDMIKIQPKGMRLKGKEAAIHNYCEWLKFSKYAEKNL